MKILGLILIAAIPLAPGAAAQQRPLTLGMGCGQARELVNSRKAVVLSTGQNTYDRYVSSAASCLSGEFARPAWVPTADNPQCLIGYTCVPSPPDIGWLPIPGRRTALN